MLYREVPKNGDKLSVLGWIWNHPEVTVVLSGKMSPASSHTGFAKGRTGRYGRIYDQTADLADQAGNESQEKKAEGCCQIVLASDTLSEHHQFYL